LVLTRSDRVGHSVPVHIRQAAGERLERAVSQVLVADVGPLIQPQYIAQIMQLIDRARPLVNASNRIGLSSGKLEWPRITEQPTVGEQLTEKTEAGDGSMTVDVMSTVAKTYLVAANFSWQTIQWSNPDALRLWFDLAGASYARQTDSAAEDVLAAGSGTAITVGSDDLEGWMAAIAEAAGQVYGDTGRFPDAIAAAPDVGFHLLGMVGATVPNFVGTGQGNFQGSFPTIGGLRFLISNAIGSGAAYVGDFSALLCAEVPGSPVEARVVEPSIGGLEVGIIGAFAAAITDPGAFARLAAPVAGP